MAISYGLGGALCGAASGVVVGTIVGLCFGAFDDNFFYAVWLGALLFGLVFALGGVLWDEGEPRGELRGSDFRAKPTVLFVCTNNSIRSQMAEAFLKKKAPDRFDAYSAGTDPREIHPLAISVMKEVGIDLASQRPKNVRDLVGRLAVHYAIFVCERMEPNCPDNWPGAQACLAWPFEDPARNMEPEPERLLRFRVVRDQIERQIVTWLKEMNGG